MSASELIEEKWFIYPRCSDAASKGLPTPRNVEIPQWTANCAPKSNLNCFQNCIQGRIAHEASLHSFSLMGIYWLYPLPMRAEPLLWSVCFGCCIFGLFSSFIIIFFFWFLLCEFRTAFLIFFLPKFHTAFLWLRFLSKHLWRHVFYSPNFFKFLSVFLLFWFILEFVFDVCDWSEER